MMANHPDTELIPQFRWPGRSREAAVLLARGETYEATVAQLGVKRLTLVRWHKYAAFTAAVVQHKREMADALQAEGIANKQNRLRRYNDLVESLDTVRTERGADQRLRLAPGGSTGLVVRKYKSIPNADPTKAPLTVTEDSIDTGAITAYLNTLKQAAIELGQWEEKGGANVNVTIDLRAMAITIAEQTGLEVEEVAHLAGLIAAGKA